MVAPCCGTRNTLHENNRTLTLDKTPEGNCFVDIDSDMIREALTNLLSNASLLHQMSSAAGSHNGIDYFYYRCGYLRD